MNCDRETPWLPKEDFRDEKVYSKEGTSRADPRGQGGEVQWKHSPKSRAGLSVRQE